MMWSVATVAPLLLAVVTAADREMCDFCMCEALRPRDTEMSDARSGLYLNCSHTGPGEENRVRLPNYHFEGGEVFYVWADFRNNNISDVQIISLEQVTVLYLDENNIQIIFDRAFVKMRTTLTEISLSHNRLSSINVKSFESLMVLEKLDLSYNLLKELNFDDYNMKGSLKSLILTNNRIISIRNSGKSDLKALETLDVSWNQLVALNRYMFNHLTNLLHLKISNNKIEAVERGTFTPLTFLLSLDLSCNAISRLDVLAVISVKQILLGNNTLREFGYIMEIFPHAEHVSVEYNGIQTLEDGVDVTRLKVLNISGNDLSDFLPHEFPQLEVLDLSNNKLRTIPDNIKGTHMPVLETLCLDKNPIRNVKFPTNKSPLPHLRRLSLSHLSELRVLDQEAFSNLIPADGSNFKGLRSSVCEDGLSLVIAYNTYLAGVHRGALNNLRVCQLDLSYNGLTSVPEDLAHWEQISTINLQGNPWDCQCSLQWMLDRVVGSTYEKSDRSLLVDLRCSSPAAMRGRRLVHFYNWSAPALCGERSGRYMTGDADTQVNMSMGSSEGMLITICVLGAIFLSLVIAGLVVQHRATARRTNRNRRF